MVSNFLSLSYIDQEYIVVHQSLDKIVSKPSIKADRLKVDFSLNFEMDPCLGWR